MGTMGVMHLVKVDFQLHFLVVIMGKLATFHRAILQFWQPAKYRNLGNDIANFHYSSASITSLGF